MKSCLSDRHNANEPEGYARIAIGESRRDAPDLGSRQAGDLETQK
ncbi:hypothetical protein [Cyclobacterium salsum]|nr:hypothetical protein [Cyclobacterium salsum]